MEILFLLLQIILSLGGILFTLLGVFTFIMWLKPLKAPADESNRINRVMLWWIALNHPHRFTKDFKFLQNDVLDNIRIIQESEDGN